MKIGGIQYNNYAKSIIARNQAKFDKTPEIKKSAQKTVKNALTDEFVEQIKAQARADAAKGRYMDGYDRNPRTGFSAMRDAQMNQYVSPEREKAISQVSAMLNNPNLVLHPGKNLFDLLGIPYTATISGRIVYGMTADIYDENGEMIAGYNESFGGWTSVPTEDETRFQYESNQIYCEAYDAARAEIEAASQNVASQTRVADTNTSAFDVKV